MVALALVSIAVGYLRGVGCGLHVLLNGERWRCCWTGELVTQRHRQAVMEVGYLMGQGTPGTMLGVWQQTEGMEARRVAMAIARGRVVVELEQLIEVAGNEGSNTS